MKYDPVSVLYRKSYEQSARRCFLKKLSIMWFRSDLRLEENPALMAALRSGNPVLPVYIYPDGQRLPGAATQWWLDKSLLALDKEIQGHGGQLYVVDAQETSVEEAFRKLIQKFDVQGVYWNRRYEPVGRTTDETVKTWLKDNGIAAESFSGSLLLEPWNLKTKTGDLYKVFTPFWKSLKEAYQPQLCGCPERPEFAKETSATIASLKLHPTKPDWSAGMNDSWSPGAAAAKDCLHKFLDSHLENYSETRDRPDKDQTSRLSPYLAFGEISPHYIWSVTKSRIDEYPELEKGGWSFLRELAWRDFSYSLLFQSRNLAEENWNSRFDDFGWTADQSGFAAWKAGRTGYPIVDAGMRQLWHTGWMHNRVRMVVASFLVKHLRINWREGEKWFWDTLVDADSANNPASWQWVAGSGADAAPCFRIFNPMTQAEKFDPNGEYIRRWVPELRKLPTKYLSAPWTAPASVLTASGVRLGKDYPHPVVDHKSARESALAAYENTQKAS